MEMLHKVNGIADKVQKLVTEMQQLRKQNAVLLQENENMKATISKNEEMVASLKRQLGNATTAFDGKEKDNTEDSVRLKKQLDKYIEEIDKCIEWLEKA
jgi:glycogen synthase